MSDHIRFGVVGTSGWADSLHIPILKSHPAIKLVAICGRNRGRASELAGKYSIPRVFTDYREMINSGALDALLIAVPDDMHYPVVMCALDAKLHVVCEKPMARDAAQARAMRDKAASVGVKNMVFFTYRWVPIYRKLRRLIDDGYLGRCYHCNVRYVSGYGRSVDYQWRFDARHGLGALGDLGSHAVDLSRWLVGDICMVSAHLSTYVERRDAQGTLVSPANDAATLAVQFANGAQGSIQVSAVAHIGDRGQEQHILLHGENGTLEAYSTLGGDLSLRGLRRDDQTWRPIAIDDDLWEGANRSENTFVQALQMFCSQSIGTRLFADAILADRPVIPSFQDGLMAQSVLDAAFRSSKGGSAIVEVA